MSNEPTLRTLQLVTTPRPFFEQQIRVLEGNGISCTTVSVPGVKGERTLKEYVRFYGRTIRRAVGSDFDIVQANYGLTAPAAIAQPKRPVVLWFWGTELFGQYSRINKLCAEYADAVIVMSEEMAGRLDRPTYIIRHGVDTDRFRPLPRDEALAELGWNPDAKHVLFPYDPGRELKNYPRAKAVVDTTAERISSDVELHAVHGVAHERIPVYMNAADALLLTSKTEGSPNSVREALACNLPIISVDVGDVRERTLGVDNCHVCDADDELVASLGDVLESDERSSGRERIDEFSLDRMTRDLLTVYDDVLPDFQREGSRLIRDER
ncbi:glycosyltransferase family 4 protein [Halostella salina]|uniref:glycosyltransferase family 4 protein n=1 Tax=Halostella salina TaxID=1547897 RepID=UPI000EF7B61C|nr:glycosyltransferase family 4 protein [Halostella salina]